MADVRGMACVTVGARGHVDTSVGSQSRRSSVSDGFPRGLCRSVGFE